MTFPSPFDEANLVMERRSCGSGAVVLGVLRTSWRWLDGKGMMAALVLERGEGSVAKALARALRVCGCGSMGVVVWWWRGRAVWEQKPGY